MIQYYLCKKPNKQKSHHGKCTLQSIPHAIYKNKFKMDHRPKCKILTLLEKNIAENHCHLGLDTYFLPMTPKIQHMKEKIDKMDFTKMKNSS